MWPNSSISTSTYALASYSVISSQVEGDDLAAYGPCKPPDKQGLDEDIQAEADGLAQAPRGRAPDTSPPLLSST